MSFYNRRHLPIIDSIDWTDRCANCEFHSAPIPPDGPYPCRVYLLGERPGADEAIRSSRPFTGKSGRELNENYLQLAGLDRDDVFISNSVKCFHPKNQTPAPSLTKCCANKFIERELEEVRPSIIVPMGGVACRLLDNVNLQMHHGMPLRRKLYGTSYLVVPQFHPALGLHDPRKMTAMLEDWTRLRSILDGEYISPVDKCKNPEYRLVRGRREVEDYLLPAVNPHWLEFGGLDTETDEGRLWCITLSVKAGTGIMILVSDTEAVNAFRDLCNKFRWFIHNALFDLSKLEQYYIFLKNVCCTMQSAYHRGNLPQGLKQLAWRLLGITMTEYEDVVVPQSKKKLMSWWQDALMMLDTDAVVTRRFHKKTGKELKPDIKATKIFSRMLFIYNKAETNSETYDPWKMWDVITETAGITKEDEQRLIDRIGPPPRQSIVHVPMESSPGVVGAIEYATRDACACLRLGLHFRSQEREIRRSMTTVV